MKTYPAPLQPFKKVESVEVQAKPVILLECIYGKHQANLLHKGTAYCRSCYDQRNLTGTLVI